MELVLNSNPVVDWKFEAAKRLEAPRNLWEFIIRIPSLITKGYDQAEFEVSFRVAWFLRKIIFN